MVSYKEQATLAYGADWCRKHIQSSRFHGHLFQQLDRHDEVKVTGLNENTNDTYMNLVATCSFYDHALNLWTVNVNNVNEQSQVKPSNITAVEENRHV